MTTEYSEYVNYKASLSILDKLYSEGFIEAQSLIIALSIIIAITSIVFISFHEYLGTDGGNTLWVRIISVIYVGTSLILIVLIPKEEDSYIEKYKTLSELKLKAEEDYLISYINRIGISEQVEVIVESPHSRLEVCDTVKCQVTFKTEAGYKHHANVFFVDTEVIPKGSAIRFNPLNDMSKMDLDIEHITYIVRR